MATAIDSISHSNSASSTATKAVTANDAGAADRFLKLLVAQMQNQDPLNPLSNAEVTSQMAQISTVSGIEKMNRGIVDMSASFAQLQQMQGAALIGREVVVQGDSLTLDAAGKTGGGFVLDAPADSVKLEILNGNGAVLDTIDLGAQSAGNHGFEWTLPAGDNPGLVASFRIDAKSGGKEVAATSLMRDKVEAVLTGGAQLVLELASSGNVPYANVKAFR